MKPETKPNDGIMGIFNGVAASYDRIGPRVFAHFGERLVERASLTQDSRVLDVATGRGALLFPAAQKIGKHGKIVGIDFSSDMVRETMIDIRRAGCTNVDVHEMDAENINFPDQSFDAVLCGFALWFFPHPDRALREFFRVLKPGGRLSLTTWAKDSPVQNLYRKALSAYAPPTDPKAPNIDTFGTTDSIERAFRQAGFQPLLVDAEDAEFVYTSEDEPWAFVIGTAMKRYIDPLSEAGKSEAKAKLIKGLESVRKPDGIHAVYRALFGFAVKAA